MGASDYCMLIKLMEAPVTFNGEIAIQLVAPQEVKPMFRKPCRWIMVGSLPVPVT